MTDGEPETVVSASLQKIKSIKNPIKHFFFKLIKSKTSDSFVNHFDGHFAYLKTLDFYSNTTHWYSAQTHENMWSSRCQPQAFVNAPKMPLSGNLIFKQFSCLWILHVHFFPPSENTPVTDSKIELLTSRQDRYQFFCSFSFTILRKVKHPQKPCQRTSTSVVSSRRCIVKEWMRGKFTVASCWQSEMFWTFYCQRLQLFALHKKSILVVRIDWK